MQFKPPHEIRNANTPSERSADALIQTMHETHERLKANLEIAQSRQTRYAKGIGKAFNEGDLVWLSTKNIRTTRPSKKLDYKRAGPYRVGKVINKNAYRLELPSTMRVHTVFHISLLARYTPPVAGQHPPEPQPTIDDDNEEYEVERILDSKFRYRKLH